MALAGGDEGRAARAGHQARGPFDEGAPGEALPGAPAFIGAACKPNVDFAFAWGKPHDARIAVRRAVRVHRLELIEAADVVPRERQARADAQAGNAQSDDRDLHGPPLRGIAQLGKRARKRVERAQGAAKNAETLRDGVCASRVLAGFARRRRMRFMSLGARLFGRASLGLDAWARPWAARSRMARRGRMSSCCLGLKQAWASSVRRA
jgi:hypothetical protein